LRTMELTGEQLKTAETLLKRYLPRSQPVYGTLVLRNRVRSDPVKVLVDRWPEFNVILCKPQYEQEGDLFKDVLVFANDEVMLKETIRKSSVIDWTLFLCVGNGKHFCCSHRFSNSNGRFCSFSSLFSINPGICLSCLDESHIGLVNQTWKFGKNEAAMRMMHNMTANFPSCCVLDAERKPVSWILTYSSCAMGMLYTLPEHRGKGYAKVLVGTMARRLLAEGYPVYCFIEEENTVSYRLFKNLGFTENPSYRETWFAFNYI
uniref:Glycine N-acyltransferase-like protein n=1 Tax=Seriola lalandi dorsalis TaxID=1841481 RepID=A0A3B4WED5_SERLL